MYEQSKNLFEKSQRVIPGGVNSPVRAFRSVGGTPIFFREAKGAYLFVIGCVKLAKKSIFAGTFQGQFMDKVAAEKLFNQHVEDVKAHVPADKLLIFEATEGWGPLFKILLLI